MVAARRVRFVVVGRVQGVGFRAFTQRQAQQLGLAGFVQNRPDGAVEGEAEGSPEVVVQFVAWLQHGPPWARVDRVEIVDLVPGCGQGFDVRR